MNAGEGAAIVRTVLGDIAPGGLGVCDAHDHLFLTSPQLPGQELDSVTSAGAELAAFRAAGGQSVIQWTPHGMGRRAAELPGLARAAGVHVVAATGLHQSVHYTPELLAGLRAPDDEGAADGANGADATGRLAALFVRELTRGIGGSGVRAGLIKVAGGFHGLDAHARWTMTAAASAHRATGAPIAVHLELGTAALDVLDLLCGEAGVPPGKVILGHLNRDPDPVVHAEAAAAGCWLAFDGPSRAQHATDWRMPDAVRALAEAGHGDRLLLGGDTTTAAARSVNGGPGMPHLLRRVRPRLARAVGTDLVDRILTVNPGRAFAVRWAE
ncbi:phosphotriesterase family protein [Streptomyces aureocirculatus]|uniref:phosphotriesterase family protein n=1 Tax=Streptomyces aureocirculatus TaxID=67275 RepID=UPI0004C4E8E6|nr:phosphotriesterase [Streptomyces aureocirculatus]